MEKPDDKINGHLRSDDVSRDDELRRGIEAMFFAYRGFTSDPDKILAGYSYGRAHHRAIHFIDRCPGTTVNNLLDILGVTKQSLNRVLRKLIGRKNDFINTLFAGIPKDKRCVYSNIFFLEKKRELEDEEDQFLSPDEFKNETGLHVLTWQSCWSRVSKGQLILKCLFGVIVSKYQQTRDFV